METAIILIGVYHVILAPQLCESQPTATMVENILQKKKQSDSGIGGKNENKNKWSFPRLSKMF